MPVKASGAKTKSIATSSASVGGGEAVVGVPTVGVVAQAARPKAIAAANRWG
jgi:hypothetical protein